MNKYFVGSTIILGIAAIGIFSIDYPMPPIKLEKSARAALHSAQQNRADLFAPTCFSKAQRLFDSAMLSWKKENERFIFFRDYSEMVKSLEQSINTANLSLSLTQDEKKQLGEKYAKQILEIKSMFADYELHFKSIPITQKEQELLVRSKLKFEECQLAIRNKKILGIEKDLNEVRDNISAINRKSEEIIMDYFNDFPTWEKLRADAILLSEKKRTPLIIVDKYQRQCFLYEKGILRFQLPVELGSNWLGDKQKAGDKKTPEGSYRISMKKEGNNTIYHKAFLLDYPNEEDSKRFKKHLKIGVIARNSTIGGAIEIHGGGGKGLDWTDGCVALLNEEMDLLYDKVKVGTPVVIVGSTKPVHDLFNNE
jgi:L,D-peptidoglycan transpeptidase YkuD (ErfK/YbiS/YcfS/YnhG family)